MYTSYDEFPQDPDRLNVLRNKWYSIIYYLYTSVGFDDVTDLEPQVVGMKTFIVKVLDITRRGSNLFVYRVADDNDHSFNIYKEQRLEHVFEGDVVRLTDYSIKSSGDDYFNVLEPVGNFAAITKYISTSR